jgi:hypothetical protein
MLKFAHMNRLWGKGLFWKSMSRFCQLQRNLIPGLLPRLVGLQRHSSPSTLSTRLSEVARTTRNSLLVPEASRSTSNLAPQTYFFLVLVCNSALPLLALGEYLDDSGHNSELQSYDHVLTSSMIVLPGELKHNGSFYKFLLDQQHIRVLVLGPGGGDDDIHCKLEHVSLSEVDDRFEALSHAWGSNVRSQVIYVSGEPHLVSASIYAALKSLRYKHSQRILWIDSICIDQSDTEERSSQVSLMGDIYAKADRVIVWLGNSSDTLIEALEMIYHVRHSVWDRHFNAERNTIWNKSSEEPVIRRMIHETYFQDVNWGPLNDLLTLPWFQRLWVVQEVVNSRRAVILCGNDMYPWSMMGKLLQYLTFQNLASQVLDHNAIAGIRHIVMMEKARRQKAKDCLFNVTLASSHGHCSDPRDKVLAVMSLAEDIDHFDRLITFNYSLGVAEFFKQFALWDILRFNTLRCLSGASKTAAIKMASAHGLGVEVPSWVPDWTSAIHMQLFVRWDDTTQFSAAGDTDLEVYFTPDRNTMDVRGTVVGILDVVGSEPQITKSTSLFELDDSAADRLESVKVWLYECRSIAARGSKKPMTRQDWDAFWKTMMCDLTHTADPAPSQFSEHFKRYAKFIEEAPDELRKYLHNEQSIQAPRRSLPSILVATDDGYLPMFCPAPLSNSESFHWWFNKDFASRVLIESSLEKWSTSRRFSRTEDGRLTRVPDHAQRGDLIAILHGSSVPYVLRKQEDGVSFKVVGECYAHGLMHGEALRSSTYKAEILRLQ